MRDSVSRAGNRLLGSDQRPTGKTTLLLDCRLLGNYRPGICRTQPSYVERRFLVQAA